MSNSNHEKIKKLVSGKKVFLGTHWDADGVTSGAIIYHMIKEHAASINTTSKGMTFLIEPQDLKDDYDVIICTDIQPSEELDPKKVIYLDHHPLDDTNKFLFSIHDPEVQSCSLLLWKSFQKAMLDPYNIFLTLLGYYGDGGKTENLPPDIYYLALELMPEMMAEKKSFYSDGTYNEVQRYVSLMNVGKRLDWSGDAPLEMLKSLTDYKQVVFGKHPLVRELNQRKSSLRPLYNMDVSFDENPLLKYTTIECDRNIQGVLCARHMKDKPVLVMNRYNGSLIGSMRVPDEMDFDAGMFLERFNGKIDGFLGGGHEKAGGFTVSADLEDDFHRMLSDL